jgi:hypothetical protein
MEEFLKDVGELEYTSRFHDLSDCTLSLSPSFPPSLLPLSNGSWYNIRVFYTGIIDEGNTTENVSPSVDIYYLLNFNDIANSYGKRIITCIVLLNLPIFQLKPIHHQEI